MHGKFDAPLLLLVSVCVYEPALWVHNNRQTDHSMNEAYRSQLPVDLHQSYSYGKPFGNTKCSKTKLMTQLCSKILAEIESLSICLTIMRLLKLQIKPSLLQYFVYGFISILSVGEKMAKSIGRTMVRIMVKITTTTVPSVHCEISWMIMCIELHLYSKKSADYYKVSVFQVSYYQ